MFGFLSDQLRVTHRRARRALGKPTDDPSCVEATPLSANLTKSGPSKQLVGLNYQAVGGIDDGIICVGDTFFD